MSRTCDIMRQANRVVYVCAYVCVCVIVDMRHDSLQIRLDVGITSSCHEFVSQVCHELVISCVKSTMLWKCGCVWVYVCVIAPNRHGPSYISLNATACVQHLGSGRWSFSAKEPHNQWLFCRKRPLTSGVCCYVCVCVCMRMYCVRHLGSGRWSFFRKRAP